MRHFKILGWLWLLFGVFCLFLAACSLLAPPVGPDQVVIVFSKVWWQEFILCVLEVAFFVASAVFGLGLLRRWSRAHVATGMLGGVLLAVYVLMISLPSIPPATLAARMLHLSPLAALALYSLIAVLFFKYEPKVAFRTHAVRSIRGAGSNRLH